MPIVCRVNGETRQDGNTREMKYSYGEIAAYISEYLPLRPGDMILSGTPSGTAMEGGPEGPFLADGDVCEVEAGESGVLRNKVVLRLRASPDGRLCPGRPYRRSIPAPGCIPRR